MPQKNLRLPTATLEQLAALAPLYSTEATVVAVAVRTLYEKHQKPQEMDAPVLPAHIGDEAEPGRPDPGN